MRRTALLALLAAGLVATGAGSASAAQPAPAPAPDYGVNIVSIAQPEPGGCEINTYASFATTPWTLPRAWKYSVSASRPVTRLTKSDSVAAVAFDGSSSVLDLVVGAGQTIYVGYAPVYGKRIGTAVSAQFTCVL